MKTKRVLQTAIIAVGVTFGSSMAFAQQCEIDCHDRCQSCLAGVCAVIDQTCHLQCEGEKEICRRGIELPHVPISPLEIPNNLRQACKPPYEGFTHSVMAFCANWAGRDNDLIVIERAKRILIFAGLIGWSEFQGVDIRWCPLSKGTGMTPAPNRTLLHPNLKGDLWNLTLVLAHEMTHIRQYRNWGQDDFECKYGGELLRTGFKQDRSNSVEKEAYDYQDYADQFLRPMWAYLIHHPLVENPQLMRRGRGQP